MLAVWVTPPRSSARRRPRGGAPHPPSGPPAPAPPPPPPLFREPSGPANAHVARNLGATEVRILVLYLNPAGSPLSHQVAAP